MSHLARDTPPITALEAISWSFPMLDNGYNITKLKFEVFVKDNVLTSWVAQVFGKNFCERHAMIKSNGNARFDLLFLILRKEKAFSVFS